MKIANLLEQSKPHEADDEPSKPESLPMPFDFRSPILAGDIAKVQSLCNSVRAKGLPLPLRSMLYIALCGSSAPMLEYLFSIGAVLDISMDTLPANKSTTPRSVAFFSCIVDRGWPNGPRGLALNLHRGPEVVRLILASGSRVGFLCLKEAVQHGNVEIAELLLAHINPRTKVPTAADYAANMEDPERWYGPEMNSEEFSLPRLLNQAGFLQIAANKGDVEMTRWLVKKGAKVNSMPSKECCCWDVNGTAVAYAVAAARVEVISLLLELGADPMLKDERGRTARQLNAIYGQQRTRERIDALLGPEGG
ncbi:unnamed protein product [Zymoseptoria tritici ST99CH_3D7]|uniref:Uncharacterized protein n=1 Tax=Zymoseptoria tritici (strain ST99CH_3D7) TaxID=1276538 RepID=A0A1X7RT05_ZYMT9|nr:unnamed protein product [Zymoseptoria tritici ST99CH_3D7]